MCKPAELETDEIVDLIISMLDELKHRTEVNLNKIEELKDPFRELEQFMRPWDA